MYQHHICRAPDPNEIEKALFNYGIKKKAAQYHDLPRLIIHKARLKLSSDSAITSPQYTVSQIIIQRIRRDEDIPPNFQNTVTNQKLILYDNNDHHCRL
jgi:hypothetical protein